MAGQYNGNPRNHFFQRSEFPYESYNAQYVFNLFSSHGEEPAVIYSYGSPGKLELFDYQANRTGGGPYLKDTAWHHVVWIVYGGDSFGVTNRVDACIDGQLWTNTVVNTFTKQQLSVQGRLTLGAAVSHVANFKGWIDELAFYDLQGLTITEVSAKGLALAAHYQKVVVPRTGYSAAVIRDNPLLYWDFNLGYSEQMHTNMADILTPFSGVTREANADLPALGPGVKLDGVSQYLEATDLSPTNALPGAYAIELWVTAEGSLAGSRGDCLMAFFDTGYECPGMFFDGYGEPDNFLMLSDQSALHTAGGPALNDARWHHVVYVVYGDGSTFGVTDQVKGFKDGAVVSAIARGSYSAKLNIQKIFILGGYSLPLLAFEGQIDEVALYDLSGLTVPQIDAKARALANHYDAALLHRGTVITIQ